MGEKNGIAANLACVDKLLRDMFEEHHEKMEGFRHKGDYLMAQYHAGHSQAYGVAAGIIHGVFNPATAAQEPAAQDPALSRDGRGE